MRDKDEFLYEREPSLFAVQPPTLFETQKLFAACFSKLLVWLNEKGYEYTHGETWRPQEMQDLYFRQGKTLTRHSTHTERRAADLNLFKNGVYQTTGDIFVPIGIYWKGLHGRCVWGGDFESLKDYNHFEVAR